MAAEAEAVHDVFWNAMNRASLGWPLAYQGMTVAAEATADIGRDVATEIQGLQLAYAYMSLALAALAAGDVERAKAANDAATPWSNPAPEIVGTWHYVTAEIALARGDLDDARQWSDKAVAAATERGAHAAIALTASARVALGEKRPDLAEDYAHQALAQSAAVEGYLDLPDTLECLAFVAAGADSHPEAVRLTGAADAMRRRFGSIRLKVYDDEYNARLATLRGALGEKDFESAWAEGGALSVDEAIAYAQRGRGERKRPSSGWGSLTPTELDVVRLVSEGLANKEIATRLFVSPRTVQTHLTHVYTKLGLTSRVQLAQEAARHD